MLQRWQAMLDRSLRDRVAPAVIGVGVVGQQADEGAAGGAGVAEGAAGQGADAVHGLDQVEARGGGGGRQRRVVWNSVLQQHGKQAVEPVPASAVQGCAWQVSCKRCSMAQRSDAEAAVMIREPQGVSYLQHGLSMSGSCGQQQSCQHKGVCAARHGAVTTSYGDLQQRKSMVQTAVCHSIREIGLLRLTRGHTIGCILCTGTVSQRQPRCSSRYCHHWRSIQHQVSKKVLQTHRMGFSPRQELTIPQDRIMIKDDDD